MHTIGKEKPKNVVVVVGDGFFFILLDPNGVACKWHLPIFEIFDPYLPIVIHVTKYAYGITLPFGRSPLPLSGWRHLWTTPRLHNLLQINFSPFSIDVTLPTDDVEEMILKLRQLLSTKGKTDSDNLETSFKSLSNMSINGKNNVTTGRSVMHALGLKVLFINQILSVLLTLSVKQSFFSAFTYFLL